MKEESRPSYFLIGFMGVGKTTIGKGLAEHLQLPFHDLDELLERKSGKTIVEIFKTEGEEVFRDLETQILRDVANKSAAVVATGGGIFIKPENRDIIRSSGVSIWLDAPWDVILARGGGSHRPMWDSEQRAKSLLEMRVPYYKLADIRFETANLNHKDAAEQLTKMLRSCSGHEIPNTQ